VTEPVSSAVGGFAIGKALTAIAGFFGGLSVSFFWQPKKLHQYGKLAAGAIIGGIAVAASITLGGIISHYMGVDVNNSDAALAIGYVIGVMSVFVLSILVNFFEKKEGKDIFEVASEMKSMKNNFGKNTQKRRRK
jgi:predicted membrane channel-forming protein YqfA (hemolysin III family)